MIYVITVLSNGKVTSKQGFSSAPSLLWNSNEKYVIPLYGSRYYGLCNGLFTVSMAAFLTKKSERTLLIDKKIQNDHTRTEWYYRILDLLFRGRFYNDISFNEMFQFDESVRVKFQAIDKSTLNSIPTCPFRNGDKRYEEHLEQCFEKYRDHKYIALGDHSEARYFKYYNESCCDPLFDIHPNIYQLVNSVFDDFNVSLSDAAVIHARLGDFASWCRGKTKDCFITPDRLIPALTKVRKETNTSHTIIITNDESSFQPYLNNQNIILTGGFLSNNKNIPYHYRNSINALSIMDMTVAVSAKYFYGNPSSTYSSFIALFRRKHGMPKETTRAQATLFNHSIIGHSAFLYT
jgi:hypothetical protein